MDENHIRFFKTYSHIKASLAERFIRTLQSKLARYFDKTGQQKYIDVLQQTVQTYNKTTHSSTKFRPSDVNAENQALV